MTGTFLLEWGGRKQPREQTRQCLGSLQLLNAPVAAGPILSLRNQAIKGDAKHPNMPSSSLQLSSIFPIFIIISSLYYSTSSSLSLSVLSSTMEIVPELLFTASLALFFSYVVAKLVSLAMATDLKSPQNVDDNAVGANVRFVETQTRVEAVDGGSGLVEKTCEIVRGGEVPVLSSVVRVSEIVESPVNSPKERSGREVVVSYDVDVVEERQEAELESEGDDWEGVERSELERVFAAAANYVGSVNKANCFWSSDVQMELYGLHKISVEGPCNEPQPMPLKLSARAKWNAWQRMGNMSREVAMEKYIARLSDIVPGWMDASSAEDDKPELSEGQVHDIMDPNQGSFLHDQINSTNKRKSELKSGTMGADFI